MIEIKDTISFGGFIINIVTMVIAIASSLISYLVYKENSSPDVIVYLEQDEHALIILNNFTLTIINHLNHMFMKK